MDSCKDREQVCDFHCLSIHKEHTQRSGVDEGYDFARTLTDPLYTYFSASKVRLSESQAALEQPIDVTNMMAALRIHHPKDADSVFTKGSVRSVCMHAGGVVGDHTTGSLVAVLREEKPSTLWITGASTPCISAFKPVFFGVDSGDPVFETEEAAKQYWLKREILHRAILAKVVNGYDLTAKREALERNWIQEERDLMANPIPNRLSLGDFAVKAAMEEQALVDSYSAKLPESMPGGGRFSRYWNEKNRELKL